MKDIKKECDYPFVLIYAVDWNQYGGQHNPRRGDPYRPERAWIVGLLLEECESHITIAFTVFENGDVRDVVCIPKVCVMAYEKLSIVEEG